MDEIFFTKLLAQIYEIIVKTRVLGFILSDNFILINFFLINFI